MMLAGAAIVAVIAIAAVMLRPVAAPPSVPTSVVADPAALPASEPEPAQATAPDLDQYQGQTDAGMGPQITDFRFEPDGGLLLSGRAAAGAVLAVQVDGAEAERAQAASDGSFVIAGFLGYSAAPRRMVLIADPDGAALVAERTYVLAANPEPVAPAAAAEIVAQVAPPEAAPLEAAAPAPPADVAEPVMEPATEAPAEPASPTILALGAQGVSVVQAPVAPDAPPEVMSTVALDSITYDADGDVVLSGRAPNEGFVQVYVNNAPVSRPFASEDGMWRTDLPDVDKGVYTLRIDEVDSAGDVVSRIETPFQRADPEDVAAAMASQTADPAFTIATRTVQPGATLWAIAEERYGSGVQYLTVFEANRDRIRDPDLIYPGQVFVIPEDSN